MNEDYLWDRTGEPDAEVQELEDVLGTLRYQPRPLKLPRVAAPARRRRFLPGLAIAATIAFLILGTTLWLRFNRFQAELPRESAGISADNGQNPKNSAGTAAPKSDRDLKPTIASRDNREGESSRLIADRDPAPRRNKATRNPTGTNRPPRLDEMTAAQRAEGEAGKEQLMLALRVASLKLNLAQRKTQGPPVTNSIRNQHKLG